ncbi:carboxylesterase [Aspergillus carlsbadensis]|nr:carboxylesterase [Aspergillus carlsbadensis]
MLVNPLGLLALFSATLAIPPPPPPQPCKPLQTHPPRARIQNGTLQGLHLPRFDQDLFLGVPFAQPPLHDLRLRRPVSLNESWRGIKRAVERSDSCPGYGGFREGLRMGEGFTAGGSTDQRYNTSYLIATSTSISKPIIAVSINYRVAAWGFLASREVVDAGETNIGLFDQRLALRWIRENIGAFGGDPDKVVIAGESAGAYSVGYHLVGFDGEHRGLFRGAILQSGGALGPALEDGSDLETSYQPMYDNITATVGCGDAHDSLSCLRHVPYTTLHCAFSAFIMTPILDGDFVTQLPSTSFAQDRVANVAILAGSNTDEGTATFFGPRGTLYTDADVRWFLSDLPGRRQLDNDTRFAEHGNGAQYKRGAAIVGDLAFHAGRRATTAYFASRAGRRRKPNGVLELISTSAPVYATHYAEVTFVFNVDPAVSVDATNWIGPDPGYHALAGEMVRAWVGFVHDLDPNGDCRGGFSNSSGCDQGQLPYWPGYASGGENMVFRVDVSYVERDTWRAEQLAYWTGLWGWLKT